MSSAKEEDLSKLEKQQQREEDEGRTKKEKGGEEEEDDDEEEYEEAEPVLAYSRMKNDFVNILAKDSVSCIKAGSKVCEKKKIK